MAEIAPYDYQFRIILIGDPTVGKSALLRQFTDGKFTEMTDPTVGVDFSAKMMQIEDKEIKLQLWDTAGHERFRSITRSYYRSASGAIIVYDITNRQSFQSVIHWLEEVSITECGNGIACLLVGHKTDLCADREVSIDEARSFAIEHKMEFIETSAKTSECVEEAFIKLAERINRDIKSGKIIIKDGWDGVKIGRSANPTEISLPRSQSTQQPMASSDNCVC